MDKMTQEFKWTDEDTSDMTTTVEIEVCVFFEVFTIISWKMRSPQT